MTSDVNNIQIYGTNKWNIHDKEEKRSPHCARDSLITGSAGVQVMLMAHALKWLQKTSTQSHKTVQISKKIGLKLF